MKIHFVLPLLLSACYATAGEITIEKSDSLIRNELFDDKRQRAEEYKAAEAQRDEDNQSWNNSIDSSCGLLKNRYLIYYCANNGRYYKGYEVGDEQQYRELSTSEVKKLGNGND